MMLGLWMKMICHFGCKENLFRIGLYVFISEMINLIDEMSKLKEGYSLWTLPGLFIQTT